MVLIRTPDPEALPRRTRACEEESHEDSDRRWAQALLKFPLDPRARERRGEWLHTLANGVRHC